MDQVEKEYKVREREYRCPCCGIVDMLPSDGKIIFTCVACNAVLRATIQVITEPTQRRP